MQESMQSMQDRRDIVIMFVVGVIVGVFVFTC